MNALSAGREWKRRPARSRPVDSPHRHSVREASKEHCDAALICALATQGQHAANHEVTDVLQQETADSESFVQQFRFKIHQYDLHSLGNSRGVCTSAAEFRHTLGSTPVCWRTPLSTAASKSSAGVSFRPPRRAYISGSTHQYPCSIDTAQECSSCTVCTKSLQGWLLVQGELQPAQYCAAKAERSD